MSPWEVERTLDSLLDDLRSSNPAGADEVAAALADLRRDWRALWAMHGDSPDGLAAYEAARTAAGQRLLGLEGRFTVSNTIDIVSAVRSLVLQPAIDPELAKARRTQLEASLARQPRRIQQPDHRRVVAPVRVEPAVRDPGPGSRTCYTIGGESHQVIEAIPALSPPAARLGLQPPHRRRRHARGRRLGSSTTSSPRSRPRRRPAAGRPAVPPAREDAEERAARAVPGRGLPRRHVRLPLPRPARDDQQHARRLALGPLRHLPRPARAGTGRPGRCCSPRVGGSCASSRSPRWSPASGSTATEHAPRRPRGARPRPLVRHQLRPARRRPAGRDRAALRAPRPGVGRDLGRAAPGLAPHPRLAPPRQVDAQRRGARARTGTSSRPTPMRAHERVRRPASHRARRRRSARHRRPAATGRGAPAPRPRPDATHRRRGRCRAPRRCSQRAHQQSWPALLRRAGQLAARLDLPGGPASSWSGPTATGLNTHFRSFPSPMGIARSGRPPGDRHLPRCVWVFQNQPARGGTSSSPPDRHDACYMPAHPPRHRRHPRPRPRLRRRRAVGRQHPLLVPGHARRAAQLRAPLAAAVHHRAGRRGPLPPQRAVRRRRRGRATSPRSAPPTPPTAGASDKADGGVLIDVAVRRGRAARAVDAPLAPLARRPALGARVGPGHARRRSTSTTGSAPRRSPSSPASPAAWPSPGPTPSSASRRCASTSSAGCPLTRGRSTSACAASGSSTPAPATIVAFLPLRGRGAGDLRRRSSSAASASPRSSSPAPSWCRAASCCPTRPCRRRAP